MPLAPLLPPPHPCPCHLRPAPRLAGRAVSRLRGSQPFSAGLCISGGFWNVPDMYIISASPYFTSLGLKLNLQALQINRRKANPLPFPGTLGRELCSPNPRSKTTQRNVLTEKPPDQETCGRTRLRQSGCWGGLTPLWPPHPTEVAGRFKWKTSVFWSLINDICIYYLSSIYVSTCVCVYMFVCGGVRIYHLAISSDPILQMRKPRYGELRSLSYQAGEPGGDPG